jgi:Xaa-Pro aminopeptidase
MSQSTKRRVVFVVFALCAALVVASGAFRVGAESKKLVPPVIRITPPTPVFDEKERLVELSQRRTRVAQSVGAKSLLVLFSTEPRVYANDVDYQYRQENNLYYLTNLKQKGATLVLLPGNTQTPEILFLPKRNPAAETWTGHMYSPQEAYEISGVKELWEANEFKPFIDALRNRQPYRPKAENIFMSDLPAGTQMTNGNGFEPLLEAAGKNEAGLYILMTREMESREYKQEQRFATDWVKTASGFSVKNAWPIFVDMRLKKSPMELRLMQHAIDISTEAHERAWAAAGDAKWEYEVDAVMAYTFKLRNADNWGYPDIVGCGPNATTLHYPESQGSVK